MKNLELSEDHVLDKNCWRNQIKGQNANPGHPGQMALKQILLL